MRRLCLSLLVALLALPAAAIASLRTAGDGTLVVRDANGTVVVKGRGTIFGHFAKGSLLVVDYNPDDAKEPQVNGAERTRPLNDTTTLYKGTDVRFSFSGGRYSLRVQGTNIDISAVGRGTATITGFGMPNDGDFSVNGGKFTDITLLPTSTPFGTIAP